MMKPLLLWSLGLVPLLFAAGWMAAGYSKKHVNHFELIGIEGRTSNALEMESKGVIGSILMRAKRDGVLEHVSHRMGTETYALYTDYESDRNGPYTYFLGVKVSAGSEPPEGMVRRQAPAGEYALFSSPGPDTAAVVLRMWQQIWSLEESNEIHRAYATDFEVHSGDGAKVDVYVGLKN